MGIHLLVLKPGGCAVGSLPAQSLPEGICEERLPQWPRETNPCPMSTSHQPPDQTVPKASWLLSTLRSQGAQDGREWKERPGEEASRKHSAEMRALKDGANYLLSAREVVKAQRQDSNLPKMAWEWKSQEANLF